MSTASVPRAESQFIPPTQSYSARRGTVSTLVVSSIFFAPTITSTHQAATVPFAYLSPWTSSTGLGPARPSAVLDGESPDSSTVVRKLHDESGLTWEQLGRLFGVSRRAVHLWANGGRMNAGNAETLSDLVSIVRALPATSTNARRNSLLTPGSDGASIVDRFRARHTPGSGQVTGTTYTPDQLLGARHDDVSSAT